MAKELGNELGVYFILGTLQKTFIFPHLSYPLTIRYTALPTSVN